MVSMSQFQSLKQEAFEANLELPRKGVVIYTFGNVSAIDRQSGVFAIKPSGVPYSELKSEDMVVVDLDNRVVEGKLNPSSDTRTHSFLYKHFPEIGGIVHTHSPFATAWAQAIRSIPVYGTTHADHLPCAIPCTKIMDDNAIQGDYEKATGQQIINTFKNMNYLEVEMVLVAGHGPFSWGVTAENAVYNAVMLEELAKMAFYTEQINPNSLTLKQTLIDKHYQRKHGSGAYYGQKKDDK